VTLETATRLYGPVRLALAGNHQASNAFVAVALLEALDDAGFAVDRAAVEAGLGDARWPGRLDLLELDGGRRALLDAAHNAAGARALAAFVAASGPGRPPLVFAASKDKDVEAMIGALAPVVGDIVVTAFADARAIDADALAVRVRATLGADAGERVLVAASPAAALDTAWRRSSFVVIAGSIFLLGEVYPRLGRPDPFEAEG
jgi:dihydrofolate synthase/folylpolyglutamate synthase